MLKWRLTYHTRTPSPAEEVWDIIGLAVLLGLLYVCTVLIFSTPEPVVEDEAQTVTSRQRN
jgi:hypothetical protein